MDVPRRDRSRSQKDSRFGYGLGRGGESSPNNLRGNVRFLFATNAGSDSISVFRVELDRLELVDVEPSNGQRPTSVTGSKGVVYVMNTGGFMWTFKRLEKELS